MLWTVFLGTGVLWMVPCPQWPWLVWGGVEGTGRCWEYPDGVGSGGLWW